MLHTCEAHYKWLLSLFASWLLTVWAGAVNFGFYPDPQSPKIRETCVPQNPPKYGGYVCRGQANEDRQGDYKGRPYNTVPGGQGDT